MFVKKLVSVFLLIVLAGNIAIAQENKPEFQPVKAGEVYPFDGYLLSPKAAAQIVSKSEEDKAKLKLECNNKLVLADIEKERVIEINTSQGKIQQQLLNDTISAKDKIIDGNIKTINSLETSISVHRIFIVGGFLAGMLLTTTLFYYSSGMSK